MNSRIMHAKVQESARPRQGVRPFGANFLKWVISYQENRRTQMQYLARKPSCSSIKNIKVQASCDTLALSEQNARSGETS